MSKRKVNPVPPAGRSGSQIGQQRDYSVANRSSASLVVHVAQNTIQSTQRVCVSQPVDSCASTAEHRPLRSLDGAPDGLDALEGKDCLPGASVRFALANSGRAQRQDFSLPPSALGVDVGIRNGVPAVIGRARLQRDCLLTSSLAHIFFKDHPHRPLSR